MVVECRLVPSALGGLLPAAALEVVDAAEQDIGSQVVVVLADELAGLAAGAAGQSRNRSRTGSWVPP